MNKSACLIGSKYGDNCDAEENKPTLEKSVIGAIMKSFGYKFDHPKPKPLFQHPDTIQNLNDFVDACGNIGLGKAVECRDNNKVYCNLKGESKYYE